MYLNYVHNVVDGRVFEYFETMKITPVTHYIGTAAETTDAFCN